MKTLLLLLFVSFGAQAAITGVVNTKSPVQLKKGTTNIKTFATAELCEAEALRLWTIEGQSRTTGTATYSCVEAEKWVVSFGVTACPVKPVDETRPGACPVDTTGTWTQLRTYISAPAPTCWTASAWTPATAPAGACVAVAGETWTHCADEYGTCSYTGTRRVRYGAGTSWAVLERAAVNGGILCDNSVFGDPIRYTVKHCEISGAVITPAPTPTGTAAVSWTQQMVNNDGSVLNNLAGFIIRGGGQQVTVDAAARSSIITGLPSGTHSFTVSAVNSLGVESLPSSPGTKVIP